MNRLSQKLIPEMSTEYFCLPKEVDGKVLQTNIHNSKGQPIYEGIAIVDYGNCDSGHCEFSLMEAEVNWMANTIISGLSSSYIARKETTYIIRDPEQLKKFYKWVKKNKLKPGDIIPNKIFYKYFKRI